MIDKGLLQRTMDNIEVVLELAKFLGWATAQMVSSGRWEDLGPMPNTSERDGGRGGGRGAARD